jgi:hypothetical protein
MKNSFALLAIIFSSAVAQAQETQVPVDVEGRVEYIGSGLEEKLSLFPEHDGFIEARLFQLTDSTYVLEVFYQQDGTYYQKRKALTRAQVRAFRKKVSAGIGQQSPETGINQEGRAKLLIGASAVGIGYYGWALTATFKVNEPRAAIGLYMLTSGAAFVAPYYLTKNTTVTGAAANMCIYGQTRGIAHGMLMPLLIAGDEASYEAVVGAGMLMSIAEGIGGYLWASREQMTAGTSVLIGAAGDFGAGIGVGTAHFTGLLDRHETTRALSGSTLLGAGVGIVSGIFMSRQGTYSRGDAYMQYGAGLLGAYLPFATVIIAGSDNEKAYSSSLVFGSLAGIAGGHYLARQQNYSAGQGVLIGLGEIAGGLIGAGTGYLIAGGSPNMEKTVLGSSAIGAISGFTFMAYRYANKKKQAQKSAYSFDFNIQPTGFLQLTNRRADRDIKHRGIEPLLVLRMKF